MINVPVTRKLTYLGYLAKSIGTQRRGLLVVMFWSSRHWIERWNMLNAPKLRENLEANDNWVLVPEAGLASLDLILQ